MPFILLATHNGGEFLPRFLRSLRAQTETNWRLLVRDDGSTDDTMSVVTRFARRDSRISIIHDGEGRKGACQNFGALLSAASEMDARYALFADQDDVWLPDKLARQLAAMRLAERIHGDTCPVLIHSDLTVVDRQSRVVHPSFGDYVGIYRDERDPLRALLVYNCVTGCASLMNRALLKAALPIPREAVMHDWWLALCAAAMGKIEFMREPTLLYRQHGQNLVGAKGFWRTLNPLRTCWREHWQRAMANFLRSVEQARALGSRLSERGPAAARSSADLVKAYHQAIETHATPWRRVVAVRQLRIGRLNLFRQVTLAARIWAMPTPTKPVDASDAPRVPPPHARFHSMGKSSTVGQTA